MDNKPLRLAAYLRVSTENQLDGFGLDVQQAAIEEWAKRSGHKIVQVCTDAAVSGTVEALDRDGLSCVLDAIEGGTADGVVFAKIDRLARALTVQEAVLAHVWRRGGVAFAVDTGEILADDPDDPMRTAMRQMMGVFAELERSMIAKRLRDGRAAKAQAGGYAYGSPAFGQRAEHGALVGHDDEMAVLRQMQAMHVDGASYRTIAATLNDSDIPTKRGGRWHPSTVQRALDPNAAKANRDRTAVARAERAARK